MLLKNLWYRFFLLLIIMIAKVIIETKEWQHYFLNVY